MVFTSLSGAILFSSQFFHRVFKFKVSFTTSTKQYNCKNVMDQWLHSGDLITMSRRDTEGAIE